MTATRLPFALGRSAEFPHRVVLVGEIYHAEGERLLRENADVVALDSPSPAEIADALRQAHGALVRYPYRIDDAALSNADRLIVVASSGRGTDSIDVRACSSHGVLVVNNPGLGTRPVSEHALALMLALSRRLLLSNQVVRAGGAWDRRTQLHIADLQGRRLGIVGLGLIGTEMARKCIGAFGMQVVAYDPHVSPDAGRKAGVILAGSLEALLKDVDFVSLHCELNDETRGLIGEAQLRHMQPHAFLVNTSRGKVVQQAALVRALQAGWIAGAALDVYEDEPLADGSPLFQTPNLLLTPHIAGLSLDALRTLATSAATQVLTTLAGQKPPHLVNPQSWPRAMQKLSRA